MTGLIKASAAPRGVMSLRPGRPAPMTIAEAPRPVEDPRLTLLAGQLRASEQTLAERDLQIAKLTEAIEEARRTGRESGRAEAAKAQHDDRERRLHALTEGVDKALAAFETAREEQLGLSGALAVEALRKILGPDNDRADLVLQALQHQMRELDGQTVIEVAISPADFPADVDLAAVASIKHAGAPVRFIRDETLPSGGCRIRLVLGELDLGLDTQIAQVARVIAPPNALEGA